MTDEIHKRIADIEESLKLPLPDTVRASLERDLAALRAQQTTQTVTDSTHVAQAAGGAQASAGTADIGGDNSSFAHLTLQEYCAGQHSEDLIGLVLQHRHDDRWREPIFLGMGLADPLYLNELLHELVDRDEHKQPKPVERWYRDLILAAELGADRDWHSLQTQPGVKVTKLQAALRTGLAALLNDATQPLQIAERVRAGFLLGELGDPRFPVALDEWRQETARRNETFGTPNGYWCYVRPGIYRIGGWKEDTESADLGLPGFWITRYPIAVKQYAQFIKAGGYQNKEYWTPQGWAWIQQHNRTQPWGWDNAQYNGPNQAVIGVTWYECMACCAWLTAQLADMLPAGYAVQLPTEAEWEAAAAYDAQMQRRSYPWGEDAPTREHAVFADAQGNNQGAPAPVGVCPAGAAACGALDMVGQVWEWCCNNYLAYPQGAGEGLSAFHQDEGDVPVRGGAWYNNSTYVCCAARNGDIPSIRELNTGDGFRVVLAPRGPS
jgi:formylglycine-generating enzyme required for sulfatase activity